MTRYHGLSSGGRFLGPSPKRTSCRRCHRKTQDRQQPTLDVPGLPLASRGRFNRAQSPSRVIPKDNNSHLQKA